jgi:hypothetical protein
MSQGECHDGAIEQSGSWKSKYREWAPDCREGGVVRCNGRRHEVDLKDDPVIVDVSTAYQT